MPKIVIREIDNTTAVGAAYTNFAVVVPGFVKDNDPEFTPNMNVFDENGVYECKDKTAFEKNIGLTSSKEHKVTGAAEPETAKDWDTPKSLTQSEFNEEIVKGKLYTAVPNTAGTIGHLKDEQYVYTLATADGGYSLKQDAAPAAEGDDEAAYTQFIRLESEGYDEVYQAHYGNQIAYELLNLGYTVLYKKIEDSACLSQSSFWSPLKDKTLYDFRYILSGLANGNSTVYSHMVDVAKFDPEDAKGSPFDTVEIKNRGRGDCIALLDIDEDAYSGKTQEQAITGIMNFANNVPKSKYAAAFVPSVKYSVGSLHQPEEFGSNCWFPASFHYLACAAQNAERFNEWYANAGYTRGVSNKYTIVEVGCKLGEAAVQMLQRRAAYVDNNIELLSLAINPIINLRGTYYIWGNRTTHGLGNPNNPGDNCDLQASHFLNIRQLCSTIKKEVYMACRRITFDPNSDMLWINFCNLIKPLLETMKADQGIQDYKIMKVKMARKAFLSAVIRIVPIEAVEDFDISIHLEDSFDGVTATTEE